MIAWERVLYSEFCVYLPMARLGLSTMANVMDHIVLVSHNDRGSLVRSKHLSDRLSLTVIAESG